MCKLVNVQIMKGIKKLSFLIFVIFLICAIFYFLDKNEILEIKHEGFKLFVYYGIIVFSFFSILFSRFRGDLLAQTRGAMSIDNLKAGDKIS